MRIVVRAPNWVGDQVMALPFYRGLAECYPQAHRALLCAKPLAGLVQPKDDTLFHNVLTYEDNERRGWSGMKRLAKRLKNENFDLGVSLTTSASSAIILSLAGIPRRVGYAEGGSGLFFSDSIAWPGRASKKHKSELYLDLLRWMSGQDWQPHTPLEDNEATRKKLIIVAPGASIGLREWPYFRECLESLRACYPAHSLIVVGSETEKKWVALLDRWQISGVQDWIGKTQLSQLISLCRKASLVIANDSGVAHVAATAAGAPTLVLFGPGDPRYVAPTGKHVTVERVETLPCSPCESTRCSGPYGYQACLKQLSASSVLRSAEAMLQ